MTAKDQGRSYRWWGVRVRYQVPQPVALPWSVFRYRYWQRMLAEGHIVVADVLLPRFEQPAELPSED